MKELSLEEKARRYDEAIKRAKSKIKNDKDHILYEDDIIDIFPELKESDGEKIRKSFAAYFARFKQSDMWDSDFSFGDVLTWIEEQGKKDEEILILKDQIESLHAAIKAIKETHRIELKKQGEQKPADLKTKAGNWYICDMEVINENMETAFHRNEIYYCPKDGYLDVGGALFEVGCLDVFRLATKKESPQPKQEWSEEDENRFNNLIFLVEHSDENKATKEGFIKFINKLKSLRPQNWKPSKEQIIALRWVLNNVPYCTHKEEISGLLDQIKEL